MYVLYPPSFPHDISMETTPVDDYGYKKRASGGRVSLMYMRNESDRESDKSTEMERWEWSRFDPLLRTWFLLTSRIEREVCNAYPTISSGAASRNLRRKLHFRLLEGFYSPRFFFRSYNALFFPLLSLYISPTHFSNDETNMYVSA